MKTFGAIAAAQLALLPMAGTIAAGWYLLAESACNLSKDFVRGKISDNSADGHRTPLDNFCLRIGFVWADSFTSTHIARRSGTQFVHLSTFFSKIWYIFAGEAVANIIPNQAERAEINQKTSDLPTFGQVGNALKKNLGQNDPKDIGKAIDRNTPGMQ